MRRSEAVAAVAASVSLLVSGVVWLFGAWALAMSGLLLLLIVLFVVDIRE